jgi:exonuclease SbcC
VRKITEAPDPEAERNELNRRRAVLDNALRIGQAADAKAMADLSGAVARLEAGKETHKKAESDAISVRTEAGSAAIAAGFPDLEAAGEAELSSADEQQFATRVEAHRREWRTLETRITELVDELGGEETPEGTLRAAEAAVTELRDELRIAEASHAARVERIAVLTAAVERAGRLREELEKQRAEQSVYYSLALDLRSDRFQAFLLEETFRELVSGASVRLWDLTARYRFEWQNEAFYVVDYDNARQARSVDTLSGGETFLASLALALQLSEQVQKAAGATMLDSLFIDEGFGTLDPEALDAAAGAIETLPIGGRMVGIISHIEELSLRLPARVRVKKGGDSSQVSIEAGQ